MDDQFRIEMIETYPLFSGTLILCNFVETAKCGGVEQWNEDVANVGIGGSINKSGCWSNKRWN